MPHRLPTPTDRTHEFNQARPSRRRRTPGARGGGVARIAWPAAAGAAALALIGVCFGQTAVPANPATPRSATPEATATTTDLPRAAPINVAGVAAPARIPAPAVKLPPLRPVPINPNALTDAKIGESIAKGVDYLYGQIDKTTHTISGKGRANNASYQGGLDALCVYALVQSSLALGNTDERIDPRKPQMRAMIAALEKLDLDSGGQETYAHGLRSSALSVFVTTLHGIQGQSGTGGSKNTAGADAAEWTSATNVIKNSDVAYGLWACDGGAYTYVFKKPTDNTYGPTNDRELIQFYSRLTPANLPAPKRSWDNSNSQYGVLGVWSAVDAEVVNEIPPAYWAMVDNHWVRCQRGDGSWAYNPEGMLVAPTPLSMTCAGLASELVTHEYLLPAKMSGPNIDRIPFTPAEKKGLDWFEAGDHSVNVSGQYGYTLYGVERVGLASGFKFFGQHDWYRELATKTIALQNKTTGAWGDGAIDTAYCLLFLARGRHPIIMEKLRYDTDGKGGIGYWSNRPRDAAGLARFMFKQLEHPFNWQVVNIDTDWTGWLDSPVLEIAGSHFIKFTPAQIDKLRNYVEAGGMIYIQQDGEGGEFNREIPKLGHELLPAYEFQNVPPNSALYKGSFIPMPPRPDVRMLTNDSRILVLWSPRDVSRFWEARDDRTHKLDFDFGVNMYIYNNGLGEGRKRLDSLYVPPVATPPVDTVKVARVQYKGNWDPEPGAWRRYVNVFQRDTGYKVDLAPVDIDALTPASAPIAHLTGADRISFTAADTAAVKAYVEGGGMLLIDMTGGTGQFDLGVQKMINAAFPGALPNVVLATDPLLAGNLTGELPLGHLRVRPAATSRGFGHGSGLQILKAGKGHVIFTSLDITSGLLGTDTCGILGYSAPSSEALMRNVIFWTLNGQPDKAPTGPPAAAPAIAQPVRN